MNDSLDKDREIIPGVSLGGVSIGQSMDEIGLSVNQLQTVKGQKLAYILDETVLVAFSQTGKVFQISALKGYRGKLLGKFSVGSPAEQLTRDDSWSFTEWDDGFVNSRIPGVVVEINLEDADESEVLDQLSSLVIESITISAVQIDDN